MTAEKSEQADLVVTAVEKFAQLIPLNIQEIFTWYFEQKGVDNPERFLGAGVNENPSDLELQSGSQAGVNEGVNGEIKPKTNVPGSLPQSETQPEQSNQVDTKTNERLLLSMLDKVLDKFGGKKTDILDVISGLKKSRKTQKK